MMHPIVKFPILGNSLRAYFLVKTRLLKKLDLTELSAEAETLSENVQAVKDLFPEVWSEGKIDFDVLRQLLGGSVDDKPEKYGLNWFGKRQSRQLALTPALGTLRPAPDESVNWETTHNLMIEGDNLEVLKLLQKSYARAVKLIYIDPPYNTGKDFVYPDNFQDNIKNYLELTGQLEGGRKISSNTEASGRYHSDWLNMIYPRIKLASLLLSADGVLLVSINDVEAPRIRLLLDEVFGEENFICQLIWNNEGNVDQQSKIKGVHEYILVYMRNSDLLESPAVIDPNIEEDSKLFNEQIENSITKNGPANPPSTVALPIGFPAAFENGTLIPRDNAWPQILDEIVVVDGKLSKSARVRSGWSSRNLLDLFIRNGCIPIEDSVGKETSFALTATGAIYGYKKRSELQGHVLSVIRNVGTTKQNSNVLKGWGVEFDYPKPLLLLQYLIQIFTRVGARHLVCDLFAGSGTTGHAVFEQNAMDGGDRRVLMVQLPEPLASPNRFATIADVTKERLRRAAMTIKEHDPLFAGDIGFRVFKLDSSNIRRWEPQATNVEQLIIDSTDHIVAGRSEQDLFYELLLKLGYDLCAPVVTRSIANKMVHSVSDGALICCLAESISRADAEPLAHGIAEWHTEMSPLTEATCLFRDSAFQDDVAKTNLTAILSQRGLKNVRSV